MLSFTTAIMLAAFSFATDSRGRLSLQGIRKFISFYHSNMVASVFFAKLSFSKESGGSKPPPYGK